MPCTDPNCRCATLSRDAYGWQPDNAFTLSATPLPIHAGSVPQAEPNEPPPIPAYGRWTSREWSNLTSAQRLAVITHGPREEWAEVHAESIRKACERLYDDCLWLFCEAYDRFRCIHCLAIGSHDDRHAEASSDECLDCFEDNNRQCHECDNWFANDDTVRGPDSYHRCSGCHNERYTSCDRCDEYTDSCYALVTTDGETICQECYDRAYFTCDECGYIYRDRYYHGNGYCDECAENGHCDCDSCDDSIISHDCDVAVRTGFYGKPRDGVFYGIELEVQATGDRHDPAEAVRRAIGSDFIGLKEDGSLVNGFEIVSAPADMTTHYERFGPLFDRMPRGLRSYDAQGCDCGMHIHVSRRPLSALTIGKLLVFLNAEDNREFVQAIAGRSSTQWARLDSQKTFTDAKKIGYRGSNNRYEALNLTNQDTIEFRIFRGTLNRRSFFKNLEFVNALIAFTRDTGLQGLTHAAFVRFVGRTPKQWPNLVGWLRDRGMLPAPRPNRTQPVTIIATTGEL